jgi:hypothetical protein
MDKIEVQVVMPGYNKNSDFAFALEVSELAKARKLVEV